MNRKQHLWNCLLAALLIAALMVVQATPVFAVDADENAEIITPATEPSATPPEDDGEGNNTPEEETPVDGQETAPVTVSTLEELLQAIDQAEPGRLPLVQPTQNPPL